MARRLRVSYAGAIYHLINRGNYRREVFASDGTRYVFRHDPVRLAGHLLFSERNILRP